MSVLDGVTSQNMDESSGILKLLTNTKSYDLNKIMSEIPPELSFQMIMMNVVQRKFKSKLLKDVCNEFYMHQMAKDRKRVLEAVEVSMPGLRGATGSEED